tara:strand:+ start:1629 stop:2708 length:1080 start_codon:yes stop_codon:yes gene_type:complete
MSHEITNTDHLVLHNRSAWHGLGTVVDTAPTPGQALTLAKLDWQVKESYEVFADFEGGALNGLTRTVINSHKALMRSDTNDVLSVVGKSYQPVQNDQLAQLCYALAESDDSVRVESAGSMRGGRRVWFLLKAPTLFIDSGGAEDKIEPYVLAYNSHDGTSAIEFMETSIRVVCNNTATMARNQRSANRFHFRHTGSVLDRIENAAAMMRDRFAGVQAWKERADKMAAKKMTTQQVQEFFTSVYERICNPIPLKPIQPDDPNRRSWTTEQKRADTKYRRAVDTIAAWTNIFAKEADEGFAPSVWLAANAITNWCDHDTKIVLHKNSEHTDRTEARIHNNFFGRCATRKQQVFSIAEQSAT